MRILHTADWHLGDRLGRIDRTPDLRRAVERLAAYCDEEAADVLLVAGDIFSDLSRQDGLRESVEHLQSTFLPFFRRGGTIVALTGNHDHENFCQTLRTAMSLAAPVSGPDDGPRPGGRFYLATEPSVLRLADRDGLPVQFVLMPYPTPGHYLKDETTQRYRSLEEKNRALQTAFAACLRKFLTEQVDRRRPVVVGAHVHVQGAKLSEMLPGPAEDETIVVPQDEVPADLAYVALGHIHKPQALPGRPHVRYSGSIERMSLGEAGEAKHAVLVEVGPEGCRDEPKLLPLDPTPIYLVEITHPAEQLPRLRERYPDAARALVKYEVVYRAGQDNLEAIFRELDAVFPRWYARDWREAGGRDLGTLGNGQAAVHKGVRATVLDYLTEQLADHADREDLLRLAEGLLDEERA